MLHGIDVRTYFEDEWSGQLLLNKRVKKHKKEKKQEMQEHELLRHTEPAQSLRRRRATPNKSTTSENKDEQREERPLNMNDFYLGLEVMHTKHGQGRVQVRSCAALYSPTVIHTLTDSPSLSPCHTRLQEFLADGRVQVEFDNGGVHRYNQHSLSKLKVVEAVANHDDEEECHLLTLMDLLLALPWYVIQALLLWLPLSVCPPLARRLKTGEYSWYLLVRSLPPPFTACPISLAVSLFPHPDAPAGGAMSEVLRFFLHRRRVLHLAHLSFAAFHHAASAPCAYQEHRVAQFRPCARGLGNQHLDRVIDAGAPRMQVPSSIRHP